MESRNVYYENLNLVNAPYEEDFKKSFQQFLDSGWYILGQEVQKFEEEFSNYTGCQYGIGVGNGHDALYLSLLALDLPEKSEVILAANSYIATVLAILRANLTPIFVEPNEKDSNIDINLIEEKITKNTKVILPLHYYGLPCDMKEIIDIASNHGLFVLEDCAQAHGAEVNGRKVGSFGDLAAFSFYPTKNLGCLGDGGMVTTNNHELALKIQKLRNYGFEKKDQASFLGVNSRLDEIQGSFLRKKLPYLDDINQKKN